MPTLKVSVTIERTKALQAWHDSIQGAVVNYDTGEPIKNLKAFRLVTQVGGHAVVSSGPLPYITELRGEITYNDTTDSGINITQFVEVTELTIRTKESKGLY